MIKLLLILLLITPFIRGQSLLLFGGDDYVYAGDYNGSDEYCTVSSPIGLDLNGDILITTPARNSTFEANATDWADNGTHTITVTSDDPLADTYSGLLVSTDAGDADNNTSLAATDKFTALVDGSKYTFTIIAQSTGISSGNEVTNGGFADGSSWTPASGVTISDGKAHFDGSQVPPELTQTLSGLIGNLVAITITVSNYSQGTLYVSPGSGGTSFIGWDSDMTLTVIQDWDGSDNILYISTTGNGTFSIDDVSVEIITTPDLTVSIGGQSKTWEDITPVSGGEMLIWKFEATSAEVDEDILLYLSQADAGFRVDDIDLSEAFDMTISAWIKNTTYSVSRGLVDKYNSFGWRLRSSTNSRLQVYIKDENGNEVSLLSANNQLIDNQWQLATTTINQTGSVKMYLDGVLKKNADFTGMGRIDDDVPSFFVGGGTGLSSWLGLIGDTKIDIATDADMTVAQILADFQRGQRSKHFLETGNEVAWYKWKGGSNEEFLNNSAVATGDAMDLTGINMTYPQDWWKGKYKD